MASGGSNFNQTSTVALTPDQVSQNIIGAVTGAKGYTVTTAGAGSIILTRKFMPTWALVVGIIVGLLTLIGFLLLIVRTTETLTVTVASVDGGTRVVASGTASQEMAQRLSVVIAGMPTSQPGS